MKEKFLALILGTLVGIAAGFAFIAAVDKALADRDVDGIATAIIQEVK